MFTLTMQTDNAAFADDLHHEICRAIEGIFAPLARGADSGNIRDANGNTVGAWRLLAAHDYKPVPRQIKDQDKANRLALVAILARVRPDLPAHHVAADVEELARLGRRANTHAVNLCSYEWYTKDKPEDFDEQVRARIAKRAKPIAGKYGLSVEVGGDPRGYCMRLYGDNLPSNSFGSGYGIC